MHRTTLYLPDDLHRKLRLLAYATRSGISDLLRAAAQDRYGMLFANAEDAALRKQKVCPELQQLSNALRSDRFRRDRRFRWNRE